MDSANRYRKGQGKRIPFYFAQARHLRDNPALRNDKGIGPVTA
jgi:hypothetical protein